MYQGTGISLRPAINVACDGLNGGEERETHFSGSRDALGLQFKSSLPVPRASQSLTLHGPISLFQIQLLLYTQPQDDISKEKRKTSMYMISFIIIRMLSALRMLISEIFHSSKFH